MNKTNIKHADGRVTTLDRDKVLELRDWHAAQADEMAVRNPTRTEWEMDWDLADVRAASRGHSKQADRLTKVLECIDAGVETLPLELCP